MPQSASVLQMSPTITVTLAVALANLVVPQMTSIWCAPFNRKFGAANVAGEAVALDSCWPSIKKSISFTPSALEHVAMTLNAWPVCSPEPFDGEVIIDRRHRRACRAEQVLQDGDLVLGRHVVLHAHVGARCCSVPEHMHAERVLVALHSKQSLPHGALSRNDSGVVYVLYVIGSLDGVV